MNIPIDTDLKAICLEIVEKDMSIESWCEIESDDMFQQGRFIGGFDADEREFCFSYYESSEVEYWFQFSLEAAFKISKGVKLSINGRVGG